jgi:hypothetical protein
VRLALAPVVVFIVTSLDRGYQTDFWQHLARGRLIAQTHQVVSTDRFTFTVADRPLRDNNWLTQLLYYGLYTCGGIGLVQALNSLALAAATAGVVALCWRASRSTGLAAAGGVLVFLGLWQTFLIRPQSLSLGLFVALFAVLESARGNERWLLLPPVMMALWANLHGGFAIGLLLTGAFTAAAGLEAAGAVVGWRRKSNDIDATSGTPWADLGGADERRDERRRALRAFAVMLVVLVCCVMGTLLNPYGLDVYRYAADLSRLGLERGIEEWLPPGLDLWVSRVFFASLLMLTGLLTVSRQRLTAREVCLIAGFLPPALVAVRMAPWWLIVNAPTLVRLAAGLRSTSKQRAERPSLAAGAALACMAMAAVVSLPWLDRFNPVMGRLRSAARAEAPVGELARHVISAGRPARVFSRMEAGNYLCWALGDSRSVFLEGHVELYPDGIWQEYLSVSSGGAGWAQVLDKYSVDTLLLDAAYHDALVRHVRQSSGWAEVARSGDALLFERKNLRAEFAGDQDGLQKSPADGR